jgi:hypothetical protein
MWERERSNGGSGNNSGSRNVSGSTSGAAAVGVQAQTSGDEYKRAGGLVRAGTRIHDGHEQVEGGGVNKGRREGSVRATSVGAAPAPAATAGTTAGRSGGGGWDTENERGPA